MWVTWGRGGDNWEGSYTAWITHMDQCHNKCSFTTVAGDVVMIRMTWRKGHGPRHAGWPPDVRQKTRKWIPPQSLQEIRALQMVFCRSAKVIWGIWPPAVRGCVHPVCSPCCIHDDLSQKQEGTNTVIQPQSKSSGAASLEKSGPLLPRQGGPLTKHRCWDEVWAA